MVPVPMRPRRLLEHHHRHLLDRRLRLLEQHRHRYRHPLGRERRFLECRVAHLAVALLDRVVVLQECGLMLHVDLQSPGVTAGVELRVMVAPVL